MSNLKPKPRFNIIDAVILLAVIAAVAGILYKTVFSSETGSSTDNLRVTLTVRIRNVAPDLAEAFVKELPSACISGKDVVLGSEVKSAVIEPATSIVATSEGVLLDVVDPTRVDIVAIVEGTTPNNNGIYNIGNQEARIGRAFFVKTLRAELSGTIVEMVVKSDKE